MSRIKIATLTTARNLTTDEMRRIIGGTGSHSSNTKKKKKHGKKRPLGI
jgi:hypothetical protein